MLEQRERASVYAESLESSQEVYEAVMAEAQQLNVLEPGYSQRRERFYGEMGVAHTPLTEAHYDMNGHASYIKYEGSQRSGSYKLRGATNAVLAAQEAAARKGTTLTRLSIASAGNAAGGTAEAGNLVGAKTTAHMVLGASSVKVERLLAAGAVVRSGYDKLEAAMVGAELEGEQDDTAVIHPFDQVEVIAGQFTVGLEITASLLAMQNRGSINLYKDPVKLFVPVGGGGLISGVACAVRWAKDQGLLGEHNVQVIGVQMQGCDAMNRTIKSLRQGRTASDDLFSEGLQFSGKADGVAVRKPGKLTTKIVADHRFVADLVVVSEGDLGEAMEQLTKTHGTMIEPAGALSMAGAKQYARLHPATRRQGNGEHLLSITSGANVDPALFDYFVEAADKARQQKTLAEAAALKAYHAKLRALGKHTVQGAADRSLNRQSNIPAQSLRDPVNVWSGVVRRP